MHSRKVLVLEAVAPVITTRIAVQWDTAWAKSTEVGKGLIFVLENQRHFIKKVTFPLGLGRWQGVSQKRMVRIGETLGKRM